MKRKVRYILVGFVGVGAAAGIWLLFRWQNTSAHRPADRYDAEIVRITSSADRDKDGIDDQTDILQSALAYVETRPKYESRYYETGYPDDGYGVCTDVVANALKGAGYDLRELVAEDIEEHPEDYQIDEPDDKIDFRRVRNLKVYFSHAAVPLTCDVSKIEEWQGGDIVIFEKHIGIVSERRNKNGVPYVIHHANPMQGAYEEDILTGWYGITGHYRMTE